MSDCKCNYHLGMGPNLLCPEHGKRKDLARHIETLQARINAEANENQVLRDHIAELETLNSLMPNQTLKAENKRLDAALDVCNQMILEVNHAQSNGSDWYTKGESGLYQQVSMWIRKASDAITKARTGNE